MNNVKEVSIEISPSDVGCDDYSGYVVTHINYHEETKQIWSISYNYTWDCGDGCCCDTNSNKSYGGELAQWLKEYILNEYMIGYTFESDTP